VNPGARAPHYEKFQNFYFEVSEKFEKVHACLYYVDTCADFGIKTTMCDRHINLKMRIPISLNSIKPIIIVLFGYFVIFL
jgi:hypothetical protein